MTFNAISKLLQRGYCYDCDYELKMRRSILSCETRELLRSNSPTKYLNHLISS